LLLERLPSANAISDVYAMGGTPLMAVAILGWPLEKLDASIAASQVLEGHGQICAASRYSFGRRTFHRLP
jgi:selenide,water dikinase